MNLTIKPLTPELIPAYLDFFDNRAFSDNSPEGPCYCTRFQATKEQEAAELSEQQIVLNGGGHEGFCRILRKCAEQQIKSGTLQGCLAFVDGVSIGWCNANDKANFPIESGNGRRLHAPAEKREKAVVCFEIAPEYRGKGVATALLRRVIADAKAEGYFAIESYPRRREQRYEWDFNGPIRLYEKAGFVEVGQQDKRIIMRKTLQEE
jgi:GNAT superfamily N-acetyltransferase